ncbi:LysR family transcriptional regulator [Pararhodobacter oceanensis]|uniref:LysR family transcriptional regulator n=1 Tax=Pararhodobacter oceanensis TaxID=2172121 RepID=A0A2T8HQU9_9RHOB|nr:LysR substrate-binding domain-containing protein [Pararhodobacter oceanensis]PVH27796.1 LysR family transcriptional regulator [Pararhodobacter oceanensis]
MLYVTLRQYQYLVAVADAGRMTDAAARLNVSQPSLSVAINRVEARLGREIFIRRKGAAIAITPFGHRFIAQARELLRQAEALEQSASTERPFVLGCFEDIAPWYLTKALHILRERFPQMSFQGREGRFSDLARDITEGRIDTAISYDIGFDERFDKQKIKHVAPVAFLSPAHPLAAFKALTLQQLANVRLILSAEELSLGFVMRIFESAGVDMHVEHKTASLEMMRSLAAHGAGVGISYSHPPSGLSYDGQPLVTLPIRTTEALADIVLVRSTLTAPDPRAAEISEILATV